ncbi:MAG: TIGR00366 family protein [Acidobacteriota bacterium]|nr:TIGR00366 family protein [Acidobacteriota bacterium]
MKTAGLAGAGLRLSEWFERWFPDAYALAIVAVAIVAASSVAIGNSPAQTAQWFGAGFWDLVAFTMQVTMLIVSGFAVASAPPVHAVIRRLAGIPKTAQGAAAFVALFSMLSSLVSWTFSLIFSGLLAREVTHRVRGADYRAVGAAAYLGVGGVWAFGLTSSAALIMATPASLPPAILKISGVIPLSQTLGLWQSMVVAGTLVVVSVIIAHSSAPAREQARSMEEMGVTYEAAAPAPGRPERPGEWLEYSPVLTVFIGAMGAAYLAREVAAKGVSVLLELNHYIFLFLAFGLLLHWRPRSFMKAIADAVPSVAGVLVQYPLYAGAVRMMTESGLATRMAHFFISASTAHTFPILIGVYSVVLGLFVPSAGGKWLVEAPYVLEAAKTLHVHLGWVVQIYNATESLANLIHPFWMLPLLGILGLKARDIVGYAMLQFAVHVPLVLFLVWLLNLTLLNR